MSSGYYSFKRTTDHYICKIYMHDVQSDFFKRARIIFNHEKFKYLLEIYFIYKIEALIILHF